MRLHGVVVGGAVLIALACSREPEWTDRTAVPVSEEAAVQGAASVACAPMTGNMPLEGRSSPYDSATVTIAGQTAKVCYGRPSLRGRSMIGGDAVPYGRLWRTGANEPTTIHLPFAASIAGIEVQPGSYTLYTIPGLEEWVVIVNRSTSQWGHEGRYTEEVRAQEVGRGTARATTIEQPVETFTIRSQPAAGGASLLLEWQNTRVTIPVRAL